MGKWGVTADGDRVSLFLFLFFGAVPRSMWDLSSPTGIEPTLSALKAWSRNHWTARAAPDRVSLDENVFKLTLVMVAQL